MARFDKKVGIITGAASGIGKEIALRYAAESGTPVVADLNLDAANATAAIETRPPARMTRRAMRCRYDERRPVIGFCLCVTCAPAERAVGACWSLVSAFA